MNHDEEHLRLLSIFHFVVAGVTALFSLFPIMHLVIGLALVSGLIQPDNGDRVPAFFGWFFVTFAAVWIAFGLCFAAAIALGGRFLQQRRHYTFCLVIAGFSCLLMPFGTVLGVFTILVLMRDSVKELFDQKARGVG